MKLQINDVLIPGTLLRRDAMGNVTGMEFLKKIFYIQDGIMLSQIREISGIDGSTLQNWTKRGWVENAKLKKYNIDQLAHILIINMLRSCMQLDKIAFLISYINGRVYDRSDDIIRDSQLYDYICRILDELMNSDGETNEGSLRECIERVTSDYEEKISGAKRRLNTALEIIVIAYYASVIKSSSDAMVDRLMQA
ncbi:MAG: DUF1836 domain-containing protein [Eubacteriales bacterium]|nr:DUF1836 domain-containing protein [Clostridiales bacterium]MDY4887034.1 DUF1836 domain-containing protein [Eubacteriales bacterium]MDD6260378.1 DUF1836 domain-containing protein [Clostridiales bacterium]MDD7594755.1 DUF1836 domain-containing protein [Clostridiales bacterium]MDY5860822.1 DUF1836 domain-containing protein [Eubacteriales bacterium]